MNPTFYSMALYVSLAICGLGLVYRVITWFRRKVGPEGRETTGAQRVGAALRGVGRVLTSGRLLAALKALLLDVLLQRRMLRSDAVRWVGHILIFVGFTLLLVFHALDDLVTAELFSDYYATVNPWLFLRNLLGALVIVGVAVALYRRVSHGRRRARPRRRDRVFVGLVAVILVSGFLLEAAKIISAPVFYRMTDEYLAMGEDEAEDLLPLRAYWAKEFGVVFDDISETPDEDLLAEGEELHGDACAECHARPGAAFVSYPLSRALAPAAAPLAASNAHVWLLYLHVLACLAAIAWLPFSPLLHVVTDPVQLVSREAVPVPLTPAGVALRRALALDACVQCGACDEHCSVRVIASALANPEALPSRKLLATRAVASGRARDDGALERVSEGAFACTSCGRCTDRCPAGIDLDDLWTAARADLAALGQPGAPAWVRERTASRWGAAVEVPAPVELRADGWEPGHSRKPEAFAPCVQCQTCTDVCPVVAHAGGLEDAPELTPQKVMNLLRLGMRELALGSRMVWDCATCYQCQEHCPEGLPVTDILYELRGEAYRRLGAVRRAPRDGSAGEGTEA